MEELPRYVACALELFILSLVLPHVLRRPECHHGGSSDLAPRFTVHPILNLQKMEISAYLRNHSRTIEGKQQLIIGALAKALEVIPRQICDNAGFDATDVLNKLRMRHAMGDIWAGVDIESEGVKDNMEKVRTS